MIGFPGGPGGGRKPDHASDLFGRCDPRSNTVGSVSSLLDLIPEVEEAAGTSSQSTKNRQGVCGTSYGGHNTGDLSNCDV